MTSALYMKTMLFLYLHLFHMDQQLVEVLIFCSSFEASVLHHNVMYPLIKPTFNTPLSFHVSHIQLMAIEYK